MDSIILRFELLTISPSRHHQVAITITTTIAKPPSPPPPSMPLHHHRIRSDGVGDDSSGGTRSTTRCKHRLRRWARTRVCCSCTGGHIDCVLGLVSTFGSGVEQWSPFYEYSHS
jgi:hypothetical protein